MNGLSISLALLSLAWMPQEKVVYIPGWHRCARGEDEALRFVEAAFPGAEVSAWDWDGNCAWRKARGNADAAAERLADELAALADEERGRLTLVGHSLGGRIVVRALARLGLAAATVEPAEIVCNGRDTMLKFGYRPFGGEGAAALGAVGVAAPLANCRLSFVAPETVASAPVAGLWARVGWFRSLAAHYAPFYLEHVKQTTGGNKNDFIYDARTEPRQPDMNGGRQ